VHLGEGAKVIELKERVKGGQGQKKIVSVRKEERVSRLRALRISIPINGVHRGGRKREKLDRQRG